MKTILLALTFLFAVPAFTQPAAVGRDRCIILEETRASLGTEDLCFQAVGCDEFPAADPSKRKKVVHTSYCKPLASKRCPTDPLACINDESIKAADFPKIKLAQTSCYGAGRSKRVASVSSGTAQGPAGNPDNARLRQQRGSGRAALPEGQAK